MKAHDRILARTLRVSSGLGGASGPLKPVARLDEHLAERFTESDDTVGEGFRHYEQLVDQYVWPEQRVWLREEIRRQHDFARREFRRLSVAVELDLDGASIGAQMTRNLVNVIRVHGRLQRLTRSAQRALYRMPNVSGIDAFVPVYRAAFRLRRVQVRSQFTRVLRAMALFHLVRIAIFGVVTAVVAQLIDDTFPASLGWWGLVAGSAVGYCVTRYLIVPFLSRRFGRLMLNTTCALLDEIINVSRSNAATYVILARTLGDLDALGAGRPAGGEPTGGSPGYS
jgi:hypothetical protein